MSICDDREDGEVSSDSSSCWEGEIEAVGQGEFLERSRFCSFGSTEDDIDNRVCFGFVLPLCSAQCWLNLRCLIIQLQIVEIIIANMMISFVFLCFHLFVADEVP